MTISWFLMRSSPLCFQFEYRIAERGGPFEVERLCRFFHFLFEGSEERFFLVLRQLLPLCCLFRVRGRLVCFVRRADRVPDLLFDRRRRDAVLFVVGDLLFASPRGFVDRRAHRV